MQRYANRGGDSGIEAYDYDDDSITIQFFKTAGYVYTVDGIGSDHIESMKRLADQGEGLNEYINRNRDVYNGWTRKVPRQMFRP